MAYTVGMGQKILDMRGTFWCQETRVTSIKYLQNPLAEALKKFKEKNGHFPKHLVGRNIENYFPFFLTD